MKKVVLIALIVVSLGLLGGAIYVYQAKSKSSEVTPRELTVRIWGESFMEDKNVGIPATAFADGWNVIFEKGLVDLTAVGTNEVNLLGESHDDILLSEPSGEVPGHVVKTITTNALDNPTFGFKLANLRVVGEATKGDEKKRFNWAFPAEIEFNNCSFKPGEQDQDYRIEVHIDHLFLDSIVSNKSSLRFDALAAADLDNDGEITQEELEKSDVGSYEFGEHAVKNLWDYLTVQARTVGHLNDGHHCHITVIK